MVRSGCFAASRRALAAVLATLALSVPTAAHPIGLAPLLQMPLDELLHLKITSMRGGAVALAGGGS